MKVNKDQPQPTKIYQDQQSPAKINKDQFRAISRVTAQVLTSDRGKDSIVPSTIKVPALESRSGGQLNSLSSFIQT